MAPYRAVNIRRRRLYGACRGHETLARLQQTFAPRGEAGAGIKRTSGVARCLGDDGTQCEISSTASDTSIRQRHRPSFFDGDVARAAESFELPAGSHINRNRPSSPHLAGFLNMLCCGLQR